LENYAFLVYVYYTHPCYQISICGKNRAYYIRIFKVIMWPEILTANISAISKPILTRFEAN